MKPLKSENFYKELSQRLFYAAAEIFPENETVYIHFVQENDALCEKNFQKDEFVSFFETKIRVQAGGQLNFKEFSQILKENVPQKFSLAIEVKHHILEHFILSLYPDKTQSKLFATLSRAETTCDTVTFMSKKSIVNYSISDILYISYGNHCVEMHCTDGVSNLFYIAFPDAAESLLKHGNFLRSYKNCIVNMDKVLRIENDAFVMCNQDIISIPKRRLKEIKNAYAEYLILKNEYK